MVRVGPSIKARVLCALKRGNDMNSSLFHPLQPVIAADIVAAAAGAADIAYCQCRG